MNPNDYRIQSSYAQILRKKFTMITATRKKLENTIKSFKISLKEHPLKGAYYSVEEFLMS